MASIEERLLELLREYRPQQLLILGDLVHDRASSKPAGELLARLRERCDVIALLGNHDHNLGQTIEFHSVWETPEFIFRHGDCEGGAADRIQIIGHHHPAASVKDGAGLSLKCPAFIQQERCWILPAFSPWAGGVIWPDDDGSRIWLCTPRRILRVDRNGAAG
jgi:metallophosphoesterase superfamily enzyme